MKRIIILIAAFTSIFAAHAGSADEFLGKLSQKQKELIVSQVVKLQEEICLCEVDKKFSNDKLEDVVRTWTPLIESNQKIFEELINGLDELALINTTFSRENDPIFIGQAMYALKVFAGISLRSGEKINNQDLKIVLEVLEDSYGVKLPKIALDIVKNISELSVTKVDGYVAMTLYTANEEDIVVDLTESKMLGNQEGRKNKIHSFVVSHKSKIYFGESDVKLKTCRNGSNCKVRNFKDEALRFFERRSRYTNEYDILKKDRAKAMVKYIKNGKYKNMGLEPLLVVFHGIRIQGTYNALGGVPTKQRLKTAFVFPNNGDETSFFIKAEVSAKVFGTNLNKGDIEVTF